MTKEIPMNNYLSRLSYLQQKQLPEQREKYNSTNIKMQPIGEMLNKMYFARKYQEVRLQCLETQKMLLEKKIETPSQYDDWENACKVLINEVVDLQILSYRDYLKARTHEDDSMPEASLRQKVKEIAEEYYLEQIAFEQKDIKAMLQSVKAQYKNAEEVCNEMFDVTTSTGMLRENILEQWSAFCKRTKNALEKQASGDLLALCEQGDLVGVKRCIDQKLLGTRTAFINKKMPVLLQEIEKVETYALHLACIYGHADVVEYLIKKGADVTLADTQGYLSLDRAVLNLNATAKSAKIIQLLIKAEPKLLNMVGPFRRTALHTAAFNGNLAGVKSLIQCGVPLDACEEFEGTALHKAVLKGHIDVVDFLLETGANFRAVDANNNTPLQLAVLNCNRNMVHTFMKAGFILSELQLCLVKTAADKEHKWAKESLLMLKGLYGNLVGQLEPKISVAEPLGQSLSHVFASPVDELSVKEEIPEEVSQRSQYGKS